MLSSRLLFLVSGLVSPDGFPTDRPHQHSGFRVGSQAVNASVFSYLNLDPALAAEWRDCVWGIGRRQNSPMPIFAGLCVVCMSPYPTVVSSFSDGTVNSKASSRSIVSPMKQFSRNALRQVREKAVSPLSKRQDIVHFDIRA